MKSLPSRCSSRSLSLQTLTQECYRPGRSKCFLNEWLMFCAGTFNRWLNLCSPVLQRFRNGTSSCSGTELSWICSSACSSRNCEWHILNNTKIINENNWHYNIHSKTCLANLNITVIQLNIALKIHLLSLATHCWGLETYLLRLCSASEALSLSNSRQCCRL